MSNATKAIKCSDCGGTAPKATIPSHTVIEGSGHCLSCLDAPECSACGAHAVADGADIQGDTLPLCKECRKLLGATIILGVTPRQEAPKVAQARPSKVSRKVRKPARMAG